MTSFANQHIWIIGASSGIGEALARELARQGARLSLSARRAEMLEQLANELGAGHHAIALDVADAHAVQQAAHHIHTHYGAIDRVIFMAAIYRLPMMDQDDAAFARQLMEVNLLGAISVTYAVVPLLQPRGGQLALCASVAGYLGMPGGQPYSASKAGLINFAESLHAEIGDQVNVKLINPGFVRTRITDKNTFHMPLRIEPEQAARAIAKGLNARAFEIHFPKGFTYMAKLLQLMPYAITLWLTRRMRGKA